MLKEWIAPGRTALLLVDMQVDFASPDGGMAKAGADLGMMPGAIENAVLLAEAARSTGVPCLFARLITRANDETDLWREWKTRRGGELALCRESSPGADFVGPLPRAGEAIFSKSRYDAFAGTGLDAHLKGLTRDTLVIAGLTTECCVDSTTRSAFERGYHVFIARDAVAAYAPDLHTAALKALELNCALLADAGEIIAGWKSS